MAPAHQHVTIDCSDDRFHDVEHIKVSGLDAVQLKMLTDTFQLQTSMQRFQVSYSVGRQNTAMMDILNYFANTLGFEVFSATIYNYRHYFYLKK